MAEEPPRGSYAIKYVCMYVCMYVCVYVYMYVCMYLVFFEAEPGFGVKVISRLKVARLDFLGGDTSQV